MPGTLSWLDPNNNKAFLDGQVSVTANGISIYYAAKNSTDPKLQEMAKDIQHANFPIGPVGVPTEYHLFFNQMVFKHTQVPEGGQGVPALHDGGGAVRPVDAGRRSATSRQPLQAYENNPIWTADPKHTPYRDAVKNLRPTAMPASWAMHRRRHGRLHRAEHGGRGRQRLEVAEGSRRARAEARQALLQGLMRRGVHPRRDARGHDSCALGPDAALLQDCRTAATSLGLLFMLPAAVLLLLFLTYPLGLGVWLGFTDTKIGRAGDWIGLENYEFLWSDSVTRLALFNTLFYTVVASVLKFALGLWLALLLNEQHPVQVLLPRRRPAALHRAHRAVGDRLLVDLRRAVLDRSAGC